MILVLIVHDWVVDLSPILIPLAVTVFVFLVVAFLFEFLQAVEVAHLCGFDIFESFVIDLFGLEMEPVYIALGLLEILGVKSDGF